MTKSNDGDKPEDIVQFIKIVWDKSNDRFHCESNVVGRIDLIGMLGYAERRMLARLDVAQAQQVAQEQEFEHAVDAVSVLRKPS